ncbi:MAG: hypothetical protein E7503_03045 [Ruminococcus sp.]|nr:hypothetical protein [Ruminococcus sp.]
MQDRYFLGGASPEGFYSDFPKEQAMRYGFLLKGGPGTGKSTLMRTVASVFADERVSLYHCASDPRSLDAVVLEDRGVFLADATAPHEMSVSLPFVTGELVDLARALDPVSLAEHSEEIRSASAENGMLHRECRSVLGAVAAMRTVSMNIGEEALHKEKLSAFAARLCKRLMPKGVRRGGEMGEIRYRQCNACTPQGDLLLVPEDHGIVHIKDSYGAAACFLISRFADLLTHAGIGCVLSRDLLLRDKPAVHLLVPQCKLAMVSCVLPQEHETQVVSTIDLQRFYHNELLRRQRSLHRFAEKNEKLLRQRAITLLQEALAVHDVLEKPYIAAQNRAVLEDMTADICHAIRSRFPKEYKM